MEIKKNLMIPALLQLVTNKPFMLLIIWLGLYTNIVKSQNTFSHILDTSKCHTFDSILYSIQDHHKVKKLYLLDQPMLENSKIKSLYSEEFYSYLKDKFNKTEIDSFVNYSGQSIALWNASNISFPIVVEPFLKNNEVYPKKNKRKIKFPIIITSSPYFSHNAKFCILGIDYYSSLSNGRYGYYIFSKKTNTWELENIIFEMLK